MNTKELSISSKVDCETCKNYVDKLKTTDIYFSDNHITISVLDFLYVLTVKETYSDILAHSEKFKKEPCGVNTIVISDSTDTAKVFKLLKDIYIILDLEQLDATTGEKSAAIVYYVLMAYTYCKMTRYPSLSLEGFIRKVSYNVDPELLETTIIILNNLEKPAVSIKYVKDINDTQSVTLKLK